MGHIAWLAKTLGQETKKMLTLLQSCALGSYASSSDSTPTRRLPNCLCLQLLSLTRSEQPLSECFPEAGKTRIEKGKDLPGGLSGDLQVGPLDAERLKHT